jgi:ATP/maltotriose-dependent transcriptional regulator MalT
MATTATVPEARVLKRRRIIERPRLFTLLDESKARVRTLIAPAGYGKSTLAEQWVARSGRRGAWFIARSASTDVAALALGLARASTAVVEGCDIRLREHLRALPTPAENVETLAEILGEDLEAWPAEAWLVIDDYHEIAAEPKAERFVASLVAASSVQFLIASRQRPAWVTAKKILYGDVLELNQTAMAMDTHEASDVLIGRSGPSASGLVSLANGWPAVIGLASVSHAEIDSDIDQVPQSLYRFFAEEVFGALGVEVQQGLTTLSVAPVLDRELAVGLLGVEGADLVCATSLDVGILVERGALLELHPLARAFLEELSGQLGFVPADCAVDVCLDHYMRRRDWDAAFDTIVRSDRASVLEQLMRAALDELLEAARLTTIETWYEHAAQLGVDAPIFSVARAEVALRYGRHMEACAFGEVAAAAAHSSLKFRALSVAGTAAHLASREEDALDLYRRAEAAAPTKSERRAASWGQLMCAIELELPDAGDTLRALDAGVRRGDIKEVVRSATYGLSHQVKLGSLDLTHADAAAELLGGLKDPLLVSSFQSTYSAVLGLVGRYEEAMEVAASFLATIRQYRLDFARPYALCAAALASAGMRRWSQADAHAREAMQIASARRDAHAFQLSVSQRMRVLVQQARYQEALGIEMPIVRSSLPAARAELVCSRALVLASAGRVGDARSMVEGIRDLSHAVEPAVLSSAVAAICALKQHDPDAIERTADLEQTAFTRGAVDLLVTAYRAAPELLPVLLKTSQQPERLAALMRRAGDEDLACAVGHPIFIESDPRQRLSKREREVYELVTQGLTNKEIARLLFIEESTVKVHTHHIYDKLGTRSRTALAIQAMLERADQATSATDVASVVESS